MEEHFTSISFDGFMTCFAPGPDIPEDFEVLDFNAVDFNVKDEPDIYPSLHRVVGSALARSSLVSRDTGSWPQKGDARAFDGGIFDSSCALAKTAYELSDTTRENSKVNAARLLHAGRVAWSHVLIPMEVKIAAEFEGFGAIEGTAFLPTAQTHKATRGQLAEYAAEVQLRQHRTFLFMLYFFRSTVRLIRWDRMGAIVSEPIDVKNNPRKFLTFIYRVSQMTREQLGFDKTVSLASETDIKLMEARYFSDATERVRAYLSDGLKSPDWPIYKVQVHDNDEKKTCHFLIGKPRAASHSPTGRCTKGYVAFDIDKKRFVFLKDCWRVDSVDVHPEMEVYKRLHDAKVRNIVHIICGGDVGPEGDQQRTRTQRFIRSEYSFSARIHYRMVMDTVGIPLEKYERSQEMCIVIYDALLAHKDAWNKAHILHRDISDGNIIIDDSAVAKGGPVRGLLIDWDLCKYEDELNEGPTQTNRSGTWRFLSSLLLKYPKKRYNVSDDIESFVHLVNWLTLRFHEHDLSSPDDLAAHVYSTYEECRERDGFFVGSQQKFKSMSEGTMGFKLTRPMNRNLADLIASLMSMCKAHYLAVNHDDLEQFAVPEDLDELKPSEEEEEDCPLFVLEGIREEDLSDVPVYMPEPVPEPLYKGLVLDKHDFILRAFQSSILKPGWKKADTRGDQFAKLAMFAPHISRTSIRGVSGSKRKSGSMEANTTVEHVTKKSKSNSGNSRSNAPKSPLVS